MTENPLLDNIFMNGEIQISWCSKKELVVALSYCEPKYISMSMCVRQVVWFMSLMKELCSEEYETVTLIIGNISAINLSKNRIAHERRKHIEMKFHYLR